jgi:biopolymer transport protein ExbD
MKLLILFLLLNSYTFTPSTFILLDYDKSTKLLEIKINESEILLLNGKEVHISLLENQLKEMSKSNRINIKLIVASNATMGIVYDVQKILSENNLTKVDSSGN